MDRWTAHRQAFENSEVMILNRSVFDDLHDTEPLLLDIETDLQQDRVWLVNAYNYQNDAYRQFFESDDKSVLLQELSGYLNDHGLEPIVYYGGNYFSEQCLSRRFDEHGITEGINHLKRVHDLGITAQQELFGPFNRHKLDIVASALGSEYQDLIVDGFVVGSKYARYLLDGEESDWGRLE